MARICNFFNDMLQQHIFKSYSGYDGAELPQGITLLDSSNPPRPDHVCIAMPNELRAASAHPQQFQNCYLFVANDEDGSARDLDIQFTSMIQVSVFVTDLPLTVLYNKLRDALLKLRGSAGPRSGSNDAFVDFFNDIVTRRLTREADILSRFSSLPNVNKAPYRVIVLRFERQYDTDDNRSWVLDKLKELFPYSNSTNYFDSIVCMTQSAEGEPDHVNLRPSKEAELKALCARTHSMCCVSSQTINWTMIRTEYLNASSVLPIALEMRTSPEQRVFPVEPYIMYLTIDMTYRAFEQLHGHSNYIYMLHPGIARLIRYDTAHNSNLAPLMYAYLLNNCNYTKTAEVVGMHRNTVIYKLQKAEEIVDMDMDDPMLRQRLLWSCMVCEYCEKVLGIAPTTFPGYLVQ